MKLILDKENKESALFDQDKKIGSCQYEIRGDDLEITHTLVDKAYGGRGLAKKLLDEVVGFARSTNKKIIPTCSYAKNKFENDKSYEDVYKKN